MKRYNLVLPHSLFDQVQQVADENGTTVADVVRQFIKLGLFVNRVATLDNPFIVKQGETEYKLIVLL